MPLTPEELAERLEPLINASKAADTYADERARDERLANFVRHNDDAILTALRSGWRRDMENAPRDGTEIVGRDDITGVKHVTHWDGYKWHDPDSHYYSEADPFNPTSWSPLPDAPEIDG